MDFADSPEELEFRLRLRAWLSENNPGLPASSTADEYWAGQAAWHQTLYDAGFFGLSWPAEVGGHDLPAEPRNARKARRDLRADPFEEGPPREGDGAVRLRCLRGARHSVSAE